MARADCRGTRGGRHGAVDGPDPGGG